MTSLLPKDKIQYELNNVKFDFYSPEEIKRISMKQLTVTKVHNDLGTPNSGSFADPCMGVGAFDKNSTCEVCHQNNENCTGHFAHIELSIPVYNPFLLNQILIKIAEDNSEEINHLISEVLYQKKVNYL